MPWHGRRTTSQQMFSMCYEEPDLCLQHLSPPLLLSGWQDSWGGLRVATDLRPACALCCMPLQDCLKDLLPRGWNLFLSWRYKRANIFPCTLYHTKHISTHETTPTLFGRKIN